MLAVAVGAATARILLQLCQHVRFAFAFHLRAKPHHLVTQARRFLKIHACRCRRHLFFKRAYHVHNLVARKFRKLCVYLFCRTRARFIGYIRHNVVNCLANGLRHNAVLLIVFHLNAPTTCRFLNGLVHGISALVGIHYHAPRNITGGAANGLNKRAMVAQKALFVGIQYGNQRYFRQVKPFTQQVNAHQHVKFATAQVAQNFHAL